MNGVAARAGLAFAIPTHTEVGVAEVVHVEVWRRNADGELLHEVRRYAIGICSFDEASDVSDEVFKKLIAEGRRER